MYVKELKETIDLLSKEIGCDGGGRIASHKIPSHVTFYVDNDDSDYMLEEIELDMLLCSCGCAVGISFKLKKL